MDRTPFPHRKEAFLQDPRISYYNEDDKYILEDSNGDEWEWVDRTSKWVPAVCNTLLRFSVRTYPAHETIGQRR